LIFPYFNEYRIITAESSDYVAGSLDVINATLATLRCDPSALEDRGPEDADEFHIDLARRLDAFAMSCLANAAPSGAEPNPPA
jgi:hypothetical protein